MVVLTRIYHHFNCYTLLILFFMLYTAINLDYLAFPSSKIVCKSYSSFFFMAFLSAFIFSYICYQKQFLDPFPSSHKNIVTYIFFV